MLDEKAKAEKIMELNEDGQLTVNLTLEDDSEVECDVLGIFECDGKDYIAMVPLDKEDEDKEFDMEIYDDKEAIVYFYRFSFDDNEDPVLDNIESDEEYEKVLEAFSDFYDTEIEYGDQ